MKKYLPLVGILLMLALVAVPALAQDLGQGLLDNFQAGAEIGKGGMGTIIGTIIKTVLTILGLVALVIFIIAGFQWMTSGGDKEKIKGAQKLMGAAVIGMVIVIIAYAAATFIVIALTNVTD